MSQFTVDKNRVFPIWTTAVFTLLAGVVLAHHEMWRDELQGFLLARESPTLTSMLYALRYDGAPPLWHLLVRGVSRLWAAPAAMQALQLALGACWVYLLARSAPFPRWLKLLLIFSYYVFYQYTVISRNYLLGLLFLTLACVDFKESTPPWRLGLWLALASLTSVMALVVAAGIACASFQSFKKPQSLLIFLVGGLLAVFLLVPPADALFPSSPGWVTHFHAARFREVGEAIVTAYLPTPTPAPHFWENPWVRQGPLFHLWGPWAGFLIVLASGWMCFKNPASRTVYLIGTFGLLAFYYCKYIGYSRHQGFLLFNFIFALWLGKPDRRSLQVLGMLLGWGVVGTAVASFYDLRLPFSCGKETAAYMRTAGLEKNVIAAGPDYVGVPVMGYFHQPFYSTQGDRWQNFTRWDLQRIEMFDDREGIRRARRAAAPQHQDIVMLINYPLDPPIERESHARFLQAFTGSIVGDEDYYLYLLPPHPAPLSVGPPSPNGRGVPTSGK